MTDKIGILYIYTTILTEMGHVRKDHGNTTDLT